MSSKPAVRPFGALFAGILATTALSAPASAFTCDAYTSQLSCQAASSCAWASTLGCRCNATGSSQILFVLDSSGSVTAAGWNEAKNFVARMIETGITPGSKVGIVQFGTAAMEVLHFDRDQTRSALSSVVKGLPFLGGDTNTAAAMKKVIGSIDAHDKGRPTYVILVTDGDPYGSRDPNPCSATNASIPADLAARDVVTILVTVGPSVRASTLGCLYDNDPSRVLSATSYSTPDLFRLRTQLDDFVCK